MTAPRLRLLGALAAALLTLGAPAGALAAPTATVEAAARPDRKVQLSVWRPAKIEGVILFSHGGNATVTPYDPVLSAWRDAGFLVVAPTHVDSVASPDHDRFTLQTAFEERFADLAAAKAYARSVAPGAPIAVAGHSYGGSIAEVVGGALRPRVDAADADVKAVLVFSTAGRLPGLVSGPESFAGLERPLLLVTGDRTWCRGSWRTGATTCWASRARAGRRRRVTGWR